MHETGLQYVSEVLLLMIQCPHPQLKWNIVFIPYMCDANYANQSMQSMQIFKALKQSVETRAESSTDMEHTFQCMIMHRRTRQGNATNMFKHVGRERGGIRHILFIVLSEEALSALQARKSFSLWWVVTGSHARRLAA